MVIESKDYDKFIKAIKELGIRPMVREVKTNLQERPVTLYETVGLDDITEYLIYKLMKE